MLAENMRVFFVLLFTLFIIVCSVRPDSDDYSKNRRDISDECRPFFMRPHQREESEKVPPVCCEMPDIVTFTAESFVKCQEMVMRVGTSRGGSHKIYQTRLHQLTEKYTKTKRVHGIREEPLQPPIFQERKECMANCLFNVSGYLNFDETLNEEILNQKLLEEVANHTQWSSTIETVFKKCIAAAKEANSQSQKSCKPAAAEYVKCMSRELFFNCPNEIWTNNSECEDLKNKLEKCPNLHPPPHRPFRPRTVAHRKTI